MADYYPRNWQGYGNTPPKISWPNDAKIAINFILNYEEGSEQNILDGDNVSENYLTDLPGNPQQFQLQGKRHFSVESSFAYGSRVGCWRVLSLFERANYPITIFATGLALERNPALCEHLKQSHHEVAGHGYRWLNYQNISEDNERQHIKKTLQIITSKTNKTVYGWYTGRKSINTRKLVIEQNLLYDCDDYSDDLPYQISIANTSHLVIPYNLDCNDCRYLTAPGFSNAQQFFSYLKDTFVMLRNEAEMHPRLMTIGLHARISGRPGRAAAIQAFIDFLKTQRNVWICQRQEVAKHWLKHYHA